MKHLFIAGTDTDVGKTWFTHLLIKQLIARGFHVSARKPIASGCHTHCHDAEQLALASGESVETVSPYRLSPAISPERALRQVNINLTLQNLTMACQNTTHPCIVEGAGGLLSPLTADSNNADLAKALHAPIILVVANKVGCINHCLLTLEAMQSRSLRCLAIIVNDTSHEADKDNLSDLQQRIKQPIFHLSYQSTSLPNALLTLVEQHLSRVY